MSDSSSDPSEEERQPSLYNPPDDEGEALDLDGADDHEVLHLDIPSSLASRLLEVAHHLGLTPSTVASRAIDLVCEEIGTIDDEPLSSDTLIQQYQARLDILHILEDAGEREDDYTWEAVDEIIKAAEQGGDDGEDS
jgi:hypothetical protein